MEQLYSEIENTLRELLREDQPVVEHPPAEAYPLFLVCILKPNVAVFALLDGQPDDDFSQALRNFQNLFSDRHSEWSDCHLTLVLLRRGSKVASDELSNGIEVDTYFCRKFVLDLSKELETELIRLPFIPLRPEKIVGLKRPASAQTFLVRHGVAPTLAKFLTTPYRRAEERIVNDSLAGAFGEPELLETGDEEFLRRQPEAKSKVELKELEISGFRAYSERCRFDLMADLTVLYGPNGFGKTSFFDALDFACTGSVMRFDERFRHDSQRKAKVLKHLDCTADDTYVRMCIRKDEKEVEVERTLAERTHARLNKERKDRKMILMELAGLSEAPKDLSTENLVRLFRATHLFGQEYQSLTADFKTTSRLPEDTVSRMLAFQDYVEAISKTVRVCATLERELREKESSIGLFSDSLASLTTEMSQLRKSAETAEKPEVISEMGTGIARKIIRELGTQLKIPEEFDPQLVRYWRTLIAAEIGSVKRGLEATEEMVRTFPKLESSRRKLADRSSVLGKRKDLLAELEKEYSKKKKKQEESDQQLGSMREQQRIRSTEQKSVEWLLQAKSDCEEAERRIAGEAENRHSVQRQLIDVAQRMASLNSDDKAAETRIDQMVRDIEGLRSRLRTLAGIEKDSDLWKDSEKTRKELLALADQLEEQRRETDKEVRARKADLNAAIANQDKQQRDFERLSQSSHEFEGLLYKIEGYIDSNVCPVCGISHKSQNELVERVRAQHGALPKQTEAALESLQNARGKTEELRTHVADLESRLKDLQHRLGEAKGQLQNLEARVKDYRGKAEEVKIVVDTEDVMDAVNSKKRELTEQVNVTMIKLTEERTRQQAVRKELADLRKRKDGLENSLRESEATRSELAKAIERIENSAANRQVSLRLERPKIQAELASLKRDSRSFEQRFERHHTENQNLHEESGRVHRQMNALTNEIQDIEKEIADSSSFVSRTEREIEGLGLRTDATVDQLFLLKEGFSERLRRLGVVQDELIRLESMLDTAGTSAALAKIRREIESSTKEEEREKASCARLSDWLAYFTQIRKKLQSVQTQALKEYTDKYGPLASTIQRRLRSVYGFEDMRLYPEKGGIAVRARREENWNLPPSDYFSDSQIQIVMLSIFLSAAVTQTWSSFAPILLDDPVQHFDDLNSYSLLDLVEGFIESSGNQVLISTCDDRFYQLMRDRFSGADRRAIFYRFDSIGKKGPKIRRLQ